MPIPNSNTPVWELVIADMKERNETGKERYGVYLQAFNGRNSLQDAYEEALDLVVYLRTVIEEENILKPQKKPETTLPMDKLWCEECRQFQYFHKDKFNQKWVCCTCYCPHQERTI